MTGPSQAIDPRFNAVRRDLADVRLADRVFAPHYASPACHRLTRPAVLTARQNGEGDALAEMTGGDAFEVIEFAGGRAWGLAPALGLAGYLDADVLRPEAA